MACDRSACRPDFAAKAVLAAAVDWTLAYDRFQEDVGRRKFSPP